MENLKIIYTNRLTDFNKSLIQTESKIKVISISRLLIALGMIVSFYYGLTFNLSLFYFFFSLTLVFIILILLHNKLFNKKTILLNYIRINKEELEALNGNHSSFLKGESYLEQEHPFAYDLDLFGHNSLYEFICRTVTHAGKVKLASLLTSSPKNSQEIINRQKALQELNPKLDFRQTFRAKGLLITESKSDIVQLVNLIKSENQFTSLFFPWLIIILPFITLSAAIYSIYQFEWNIILSLSLLLNGLVYGMYGKKINRLHASVSRKKIILDTYSELILLIEEYSFSSNLLNQYHQLLTNSSTELKSLANYSSWLDNRLNILYSPLANLFFLHDLHFCLAIEKWKIKNKDKVSIWLEAIGEFDCLNSLANLAYNHPTATYPHLSDGTPLLNAEEMVHPLMSNKTPVPNNFELGKEFTTVILTGANMAGKSTFLRSTGVNLVLAYTGAPVFAKSFSCTLMHLVSTMRISDSLKDNTSYFYAELQRLKQIKEMLVSGIPCFILLDEILKGTNSNDKQKGSKAFVENLIQYSCLGMVATHDLELGVLQTQYPNKVKNFCFESFIKNNELLFDYKIREGLAQNTNASFLMKELGII